MLGMGIANIFGLDPRAGLLVGSVSLVGGIGTTLAWVPDFVERLGIHNALEIGTAGSMLGLIIACIIGGPIASYLMREHKLTPSHDTRLDIGPRSWNETWQCLPERGIPMTRRQRVP